ncbi:MFS transporter [Halobellus captivus]|uniref:MFS transporter n=1 Tax=Halobellus captivus TaxID=2592614 RepID=UPI0019395AE5|nr:MFS transporter [Halobellus captivus]
MNEQPRDDGEASFSGTNRQRMIIFLGVIAGMLMAAMDQSIIAPALPTIVGDLSGGGSYSWLVTGYLITVTVTIALYGRLSDIYGRGPVYSFAIVTFLIGSVLSGFAGQIPILDQYLSGMAQITIFRAIQGIGGGGLLSMATIIVGDLFSPRERGKYISYVMVLRPGHDGRARSRWVPH